MHEALVKLYSGDYNRLMLHTEDDGTVTVKLTRRGEGKTYCFRVKDLYGENEEVLEYKEIEVKLPPHIEARMKEARGEKPVRR